MVTGWKTATVKETSTIFGRIGFRGYTKEDIVDAYEGAISLSPSNLKDGKVDITNSTFISWDKYNESPEIKLQDGDVVLVKTGSTYGKSAYVDNLKWATTLNPQIVVFKNVKINKKLFAYFVQTPEFQKQIEATIVGGAIPTLSQNQVYQFEITFPIDVGEQKRIAEALSDVDSMISSLEKLIAKKKAVKQGAMQELLTGKKRLPGFDGEWNYVAIGKMTDVFSGGTPNTSIEGYWGGTIPWMSSGELNLKIVREVAGRITDDGLKNSSTHFIPPFCVLIGLAGQGKTRGTAAYNTFSLCTNQSIAAIYPNDDEFNSKYLYYVMDTQYDNLRELSSGDGGRGGLTKKLLQDYVVYIPRDVEEQKAIASILSDMDNEIEALEQKLEKTRQIKQGMMQQLLTGKIRLV